MVKAFKSCGKNFKTLARVYYIQALSEVFWSFARMIVPGITLIHYHSIKNGKKVRIGYHDRRRVIHQTFTVHE